MRTFLVLLILILAFLFVGYAEPSTRLGISWIGTTKVQIDCSSGTVYYNNGHGETWIGYCENSPLFLSHADHDQARWPMSGATVIVKQSFDGQEAVRGTVPYQVFFPLFAQP